METWRPCLGFADRYEVSSNGQIRNLITGKIRKPWKNNRGYLTLKLSIAPNKTVTRTVHSLVAEAFISARPEGLQINHKDSNKENNPPDNLEWVTAEENIAHARRHGQPTHRWGRRRPRSAAYPSQVGALNYNARLTEDDARSIIGALAAGETQRAIALRYGVARTLVQAIGSGRRWSHIGDAG